MPEIKNYLPLNRKVFNHEFWTEKRVFSKYEAWLDLLREARYDEDIRGEIICNQRVEWGRGELPGSLRFLAEKWMWSKGKVDSFLQTLKKLGMIKTRTASGTVQTIITICKYDEYNPVFKNTGQSKDSKRTVEGQSKDKSKEDKKGNKVNKGIISETEVSDGIYPKCMELYNSFILDKTNTGAKIDAATGAAMNKIIAYLKTQCKDKENLPIKVPESFGLILSNYDSWDKFHQGQLNLNQIESNLINIMNAIRKHKIEAKSNPDKVVYTDPTNKRR
jgi:hypothetical protein